MVFVPKSFLLITGTLLFLSSGFWSAVPLDENYFRANLPGQFVEVEQVSDYELTVKVLFNNQLVVIESWQLLTFNAQIIINPN
jgi:hypothetical protein